MADMHRIAEIIAEHERRQLERPNKGFGQSVLEVSSTTGGNNDAKHGSAVAEFRVPEFPRSATKRYDDFPILRANDALILGDSEIPDHDHTMFQLAAEMAIRESIKTLIIAGDFVALDSFSTWKKSTGTVYNFRDEMKPALETLRAFVQIFDRIVYITGNHERRIARQTDGNIILGYFLDGLNKVEYSEYAYCVLDCNGDRFLVCHPDNYSAKPGVIPQKLESIYNMHVIAGHTHRQTYSISPNGLHYCLETGHCRDINRTQYKALRINTHPEWQTGFVVVLDGIPFLVNKTNHRFIGRS